MIVPASSIRMRRKPRHGTWRERPALHRAVATPTAREFAQAAWIRLAPRIALPTYAAALWIGTHLAPSKLPHAELFAWEGFDKVCHFCAYTGLMLLVLWTLLANAPLRRWLESAQSGRWWLLGAAALVALCGMVDEITQPLVGRCCDWRDWLANVAGITTAVLMCRALLWFKGAEYFSGSLIGSATG